MAHLEEAALGLIWWPGARSGGPLIGGVGFGPPRRLFHNELVHGDCGRIHTSSSMATVDVSLQARPWQRRTHARELLHGSDRQIPTSSSTVMAGRSTMAVGTSID
ncbi:hypothetical protein E2562_034445 [Oryza meyeriana var. granulata]|uniref:Uncharacterized protein n=1 Tax=Oryza meyeriana var. granulata TaxID=110450 RepID=A0A6G1FFL4_9ORYZ|nr:hypothetical protein E2562_034445 [Oryza meyeriana var. granulata]